MPLLSSTFIESFTKSQQWEFKGVWLFTKCRKQPAVLRELHCRSFSAIWCLPAASGHGSSKPAAFHSFCGTDEIPALLFWKFRCSSNNRSNCRAEFIELWHLFLVFPFTQCTPDNCSAPATWYVQLYLLVSRSLLYSFPSKAGKNTSQDHN